MRYIIPCFLIMLGLTQCKKDSPQDPAAKNIFTVSPDPDYLLDTVTVSVKTNNEIHYGYFFSYDNLNRVTKIKNYEYFGNIPLVNNGTWTFNYQGNSSNPESMDQVSYTNCRVYFFYNADGSKNRDSIVSTATPTTRAVRKYDYDPAFNYAVARHYSNGSLKPSLMDSATFINYNCNAIYSKEMSWTGSIAYTYEWFDNFYAQVDNRPNPFSKLNIFPALFLAPYLKMTNPLTGNMWKSNIVMDFAFQNNPLKYKFYDHAIGGYSHIDVSTAEEETYDSKNRITKKIFADSTGNVYGMSYFDRYYATYKYR